MTNPSLLVLVVIGGSAGVLSGLFGIGGGVIIVTSADLPGRFRSASCDGHQPGGAATAGRCRRSARASATKSITNPSPAADNADGFPVW